MKESNVPVNAGGRVEKEDGDYDLSGIGDSGALEGVAPGSAEEEDGNKEETAGEEPEEANDESPRNAEAGECRPEDMDPGKLAARLLRIASEVLGGGGLPEEVRRLLDADSAAAAAEEAYRRGLIEGRNEQIEERLRVPAAGAPDLCGAPPSSGRIADSIFDLARLAHK